MRGAALISLPAVFPEPDIALDLLRPRQLEGTGDVVDVKLERLQFEGPDARVRPAAAIATR
jgi:hypothetical protein